MPRQQRRRLERDQLKSGHVLAARGLPASPRREQMRDVARVLYAKLCEAGNPQRAGEAASLAQSLAEASLAAAPGTVTIACRRGCAYCCHAFVGATPPEVFLIAGAVRARRLPGIDAATIAARALPLAGLDAAARVGARLPCPLLEAGACSAYALRPLTCRQATALDVEACLAEFEGRGSDTDRIEVASAHLAHASNAQMALLGALCAARLPLAAYEFSAALVTALETADSEQRWLAGEAVFAGLPPVTSRPAVIDRIAGMIATDLGV